eukprot:PhF_6_TR26235/c0_g2_i4/m.37458
MPAAIRTSLLNQKNHTVKIISRPAAITFELNTFDSTMLPQCPRKVSLQLGQVTFCEGTATRWAQLFGSKTAWVMSEAEGYRSSSTLWSWLTVPRSDGPMDRHCVTLPTYVQRVLGTEKILSLHVIDDVEKSGKYNNYYYDTNCTYSPATTSTTES